MSVNSKDKIRTVRQAVGAGVEFLAHDIESGHPEVLSECLQAMARFHTYSFGNVLLISTQRPKLFRSRLASPRNSEETSKNQKMDATRILKLGSKKTVLRDQRRTV